VNWKKLRGWDFSFEGYRNYYNVEHWQQRRNASEASVFGGFEVFTKTSKVINP